MVLFYPVWSLQKMQADTASLTTLRHVAHDENSRGELGRRLDDVRDYREKRQLPAGSHATRHHATAPSPKEQSLFYRQWHHQQCSPCSIGSGIISSAVPILQAVASSTVQSLFYRQWHHQQCSPYSTGSGIISSAVPILQAVAQGSTAKHLHEGQCVGNGSQQAKGVAICGVTGGQGADEPQEHSVVGPAVEVAAVHVGILLQLAGNHPRHLGHQPRPSPMRCSAAATRQP